MRGTLVWLALLGPLAATAGHAQPAVSADSVLRAVAAALVDNPRLRPDSVVWYPDDPAAAALALATGTVRSPKPASGTPPRCPWSGDRSGSPPVGYAVAVRRAAAPAGSVRVAVSFRCSNPPGYTHPIYWLEHTYLVGDGGSGWRARLEAIAVTAIPRPLPNVTLALARSLLTAGAARPLHDMPL